MKTNIEIDEELMEKAMAISGIKTKKEAIEEALRQWVYTLALQKVEDARGPELWQGDLENMRTNSSPI